MLRKPKLPRLSALFGRNASGGRKLNQTQLYVLAGAFCFFIACLTFFLLPNSEEGKKVEPMPTVQVVVAKQDIPQRTVIKESMLKLVDMPQNAVPSGAMQSISEAVDKPANVPIQEGDILTNKKIVTDPRLAGFAGLIPPDCRAISVGISDITGIAGFAKPGDYVDVMIVRNNKQSNNVSGEILLQNVLLLGINKSAETAEVQSNNGNNKDNKDKKDDKDKAGGNASANASKEGMATATLALTSEEALKLAVESQTGTVYLVLRPVVPDDVFTIDTEYRTVTGETPQPAAQQAANNAPVSAPVASYTPPAAAPSAAVSSPVAQAPALDDGIEVIRGTESKLEGGN